MTALGSMKKEILIPAAIFLYLLLLGIGTVAEVFDISSILEWPVWRPPGKY